MSFLKDIFPGRTRTYLKIINQTNTDIINTEVSGIDNYDWDNDNRPDHNFNGVFIAARTSREAIEDLNKNAQNCPFNMTLFFKDDSKDTFRIHQKYAVDCCPGFSHSEKSHNITYQRTNENRLEIIISDLEEQQLNAEKLNAEGEAAVKQNKYRTAIEKFNEALSSTNQCETIGIIKSNKAVAEYLLENEINNEKAEKLKQEGELAANQKQYNLASAKFDEALNLATKSQTIISIYLSKDKIEKEKQSSTPTQSDTPEKLNEEGLKAIHQENYDEAIKKLNKALKLVQELHISIKTNKAKACNKKGQSLVQEAWSMETGLDISSFSKTKNKLNEAKILFEKAQNLKHDLEQESNLQKVIMKIDVNDLISEAAEIEKEATDMVQDSNFSGNVADYDLIKSKYIVALDKLKHGKQKIEEGINLGETKFSNYRQIIDARIEDITKAKARLEVNHISQISTQ